MRFFIILLATFLIIAVSSKVSFPQTKAPKVEAPKNILRNGDFAQDMDGWRFNNSANKGTAVVVDANVGLFSRALRITTTAQATDNPWTVQLYQLVTDEITIGNPLTLKVWLRSRTGNKIRLFVRESQEPYTDSISQALTLTPQWQEYEFLNVAKQDYESDEMQVGLNLAYSSGEVEIAGMRLFHTPSSIPRPKLDLQIGHSRSVHTVAFSPDGRIVASGGVDAKIKLWNANSGMLRRTLSGHRQWISAVTFSPDSKILASASADKTVRLWNSQTGTIQHDYPQQDLTPNTIAFSPDGRMLAIGGSVQIGCGHLNLTLRDLTTSESERLKADKGILVLGINSNSAATTSGLLKDDVIQRVATKEVLTANEFWFELRQHASGERVKLDIIRQGKPLALTVTLEKGTKSSGEIRLIRSSSGALLRTMKSVGATVNSITFAADGKLLASGGGDSAVVDDIGLDMHQRSEAEMQRRKFKDGYIVVTGVTLGGAGAKAGLQIDDVIQSINHKPVASLSEIWSIIRPQPHGQKVIVGIDRKGEAREVPLTLQEGLRSIGEVRLWKVADGAALRIIKDNMDWVQTVAFAPDRSSLASYDGSEVRLWNVRSGLLQRTLPPSEDRPLSIAFSPDSRFIAGGTGYNNAMLWNLQSGESDSTNTGRDNWPVVALAYSPDGRTLAGGSGDGSVLLWDVPSKTLRLTLGSVENVYAVAISPDGRTLASGGSLNCVHLWDTTTGELLRTLKGHDLAIVSLTFSPDGHTLATSSPEQTNLWDVETGALRRSIKQVQSRVERYWMFAMPRRVAFSPDSKTLAVGGEENTIQFWDVATGESKKILTGHGDVVRCIAFSPDGRIMASASRDETIKLWDAQSGHEIRTLKEAVNDYAASLAFSPDSTTLAIGADQAVNLWDVHSGTLQRKMDGIGGNVTVTFAPNGKTVVGAYLNGEVYFWDVQTGAKQRMLRRIAAVEEIVFSPDGRRVFSANWDSTVRVWDANNGRFLATLLALPESGSAVNGKQNATLQNLANQNLANKESLTDYLVLTPEGYYAGSATADRYVRFKLGDDLFPAESFQTRYYRPDLVKRKLTGEEVPQVGIFKGAYPPIIGFSAPPNGSKITGNSIRVAIAASDDSEIEQVNFFINGRRVDVKPTLIEDKPLTAESRPLTADSKPLIADSRSIPTAHKHLQRYAATLPVPSDGMSIKVQAIAIDNDGLQSPREEILFTREVTNVTVGKLLGLCVGVSRYQDSRLNLKFADNDAKVLSQKLSTQRGIYSGAKVTALTNDKATAREIKTQLDELITNSTRADTIIVSLSGHGWRDEGRDFYFAPYEVNRHDIAQTALPWREVTNRLTQLSQKSKRVLVLLDTCHSGSAATNEELVKAILASNAGVLVFASSRGSEVSLENVDWGHGAFTRALLEAIEGKAAPQGETKVTLLDFISYVSRRVKELTENQQHPQVPFLHDFDIDAALMERMRGSTNTNDDTSE